MKRIYISGKIGEDIISDGTREKFRTAEIFLRKKGFEVFSPCNEAWQRALKRGYETQFFEPGGVPANAISFYEYVLLRDLMAMSLKDSVYLLSDWDSSPGAKSEFAYATAAGKDVFFEDRSQAVLYLEDRWRKGGKFITRLPQYKYVEHYLKDVWMPIEACR